MSNGFLSGGWEERGGEVCVCVRERLKFILPSDTSGGGVEVDLRQGSCVNN